MSGSGSVFARARVLDDATLKRSSQTTAFGTAGVSVSTKAGRLYKIAFVNSNATTAYYAQIFDRATAPIATNVPIWEAGLMAKAATTGSGYVEIDFGLHGLYVANGIGIAISTTKGVLTFAGATDGTAYVLYTATV